MKKVKLKNTIFTNGFIESLNKLLEQPITPAQGFHLAKFARQVGEKQELFLKAKEKMIKKYGQKDESGYKIKPEDRDKVEAEWQELLAIEESYNVEPIKLRDDVKVTTKDLMMLEDILIV